ncbi:MAG: hypothetical protein ACKOA9_08670 [Actinomycetota bacterium]
MSVPTVLSIVAPDHVARRTRVAGGAAGLVRMLVRTMRSGIALGVAGLVAIVAVMGVAAAPADAATARTALEPSRSVERVLVVSVPHVGWADLERADAPNLKRLLADSAVANLTARSGGGGFAAGYLTLGAGKRSKGTDTASDGMGFGVDERFGDDRAGAAFTRRTGVTRARGLVQLGIVGLTDVNEAEAGGSSIGALGSALRDAGYRSAVIGNSDGSVPDDDLPRYRRYQVAGLMTGDGTVDGGDVSRRLLERDARAPFGLRLDNDAVLEAFRAVWSPKSVVMVEGSDLVRSVASRPPAVATQDAAAFDEALHRTDDLVGALLAEVDPARDAVVVVSPYGSRVTKGLTLVGVRAPGIDPGLMKSSSTRRNGFVLLVDVAPSILRILDIPRPSSMNGRPFAVGSASGTAQHRIDRMIDETDAALFRDRVLTPVTVLATVLAGLVAIAAIVTWEVERRGPWRGFARFGSSWLLGLVPAVYLARLLPMHDAGVGPYFVFLAGVALALGALYEIAGAGRTRKGVTRPTSIGLVVLVAILTLDLVTGARLQLSTAFGYTPSIGVRFAGIGNVAYAFLGASVVFLAGLVAHRVGGRRGVAVASALMFVALVVDAAPMFGGDVGGALSLTVAYLVTGLLLGGARIRWRTVLGLAVAALAVVGVVAVVDLARPAQDRTHLGRLLTNARERGYSEITDVILRKLNRNLDTWTTSAWRVMIVIGVLFAAYLWWRGRPRTVALVARVPQLRASLVGFTVLAVAGYALNDSGVAIPAVALYVFVAVMVGLLVRLGSDPLEPMDAAVDPPPDQVPETADSSAASVRSATPSHR